MDSYSKALAVRSGLPEVVLEEEEEGEGLKKELALDDILEILARLPVESLLRFKCVSKLWYSLIMSPNLIAMHYTHSHRKRKVPLLFLLSSEQYANPSDALKKRHAYERSLLFELGDLTKSLPLCGHLDHVEIVGCLFGVVCLSISRHPQLYVLWNPATGKVREIGDAPMEGPASTEMAAFIKNGSWYGSGFCFDPVTNAFKIAQFRLTVTEAGETRAQVNVFSTVTSSWTEKNIHVPCCIRASGSDGLTLKKRKVATCVNGYMHMLVALFQDNRTLEDIYILRYDMTDEVFQRIEMPFPLTTDCDHVAPYQGCLALFVHKRTGSYAMDSSYNEVDVWVLNDCGGANQSWSKILTCKPSIKVRVAQGFFRKDNVDLILLCEEPSSSLYLYDPEKGEAKKCSSEETRPHTFLYSESLSSLN